MRSTSCLPTDRVSPSGRPKLYMLPRSSYPLTVSVRPSSSVRACHLSRRERRGLRSGREGVFVPACFALCVPVRLADSGNLIVGVLGRIGLRCRDRFSDPTSGTGDTGPSNQRWRPVPRELVARPLPGCRTCALIGRVYTYNPKTEMAYAIPARREQRGVFNATCRRREAPSTAGLPR